MISKALAERIILAGTSNPTQNLKDCIHLFDLNPSAFIYHNIDLPISIETDQQQNPKPSRDFRRLAAMFKHAGFRESRSSPVHLVIKESDSIISAILMNRNSTTTPYSQIIHKTSGYHQELPEFVNRFSTNVFSTNLGLAALP